MKSFVIGGGGLVGTELVRMLKAFKEKVWHTRRTGPFSDGIVSLDLSQPILALPHKVDVVYLVGAIKSFKECAADPSGSWIVNADAPIEIMRKYVTWGDPLPFFVFVSSDAVEWAPWSAYGRQKAHVESVAMVWGAGIVRAAKITPERVTEFCDLLIDVGTNRRAGVHRWA